MLISFGRFKGREVQDLPRLYLRWLLDNEACDADTALEQAVRKAYTSKQFTKESAALNAWWDEMELTFAQDEDALAVLKIAKKRLHHHLKGVL